MLPIYRPDLSQEDLRSACEAINSSWISSIGPYKQKAADLLANLLDVKHVLLTNNGTSATHLLAHAIKHKNPKIDKIIVPDNAYVAAYNSFLYGPTYKLLPVPSDLDTWNYDINELLKCASDHGPDEAAILVVHNLGNPVDVLKLKEKLPHHLIVEDNCEGLWGKYGRHRTGTQCLASSLSFYGNKSITCGEGGAVVTSDSALHDHLERLHAQGQTDKRFVHDRLGYNYRMTNVQAAILYSQLGRIQRIMADKQRVYEQYTRLQDIPNVRLQQSSPSCHHPRWMVGIRIKGNPGYSTVKRYLANHNIDTRPMFYPMSEHGHLKQYANTRQEHNSMLINRECVVLPSYPFIKNEEIRHVVKIVGAYVKKL